MERWTSSSAEEGIAAEVTPENGEGSGEERPTWHGFTDEEEEADQPIRPWRLRDPIPTPPEEEAQNAEEVVLAVEQQQQSHENVGPVEQWMRHRPSAFHELRRLRTRGASDSDPSALELVIVHQDHQCRVGSWSSMKPIKENMEKAKVKAH